MERQRELTDKATDSFRSLSDVATDDAPAEVRDAVGQSRQAITQLPAQRSLVDEGDNAAEGRVHLLPGSDRGRSGALQRAQPRGT
ncbi:nitrate- and nitrite sensing domain-containing protein [Streptomyces sp. NPDC057582]|uniref:nitrate- and nitrite sensing domain-containing protein n=1 Tax=Streptomyces sp. NPDC057582 TaxID=3346174 RepID=UPI00369E76E0